MKLIKWYNYIKRKDKIMTFKDYRYERPNLEVMKKEYDEVIEIFKNANSVEEQIASFDRINKVRNHFTTMQYLCSCRAKIDTTDEFYNQEQDFFDENLPIVSGYENELKKPFSTVNSKYNQNKNMENNYLL